MLSFANFLTIQVWSCCIYFSFDYQSLLLSTCLYIYQCTYTIAQTWLSRCFASPIASAYLHVAGEDEKLFILPFDDGNLQLTPAVLRLAPQYCSIYLVIKCHVVHLKCLTTVFYDTVDDKFDFCIQKKVLLCAKVWRIAKPLD